MEGKRKRRSIFDLIREYTDELEELKEGLILPPMERPSWDIRTCTLEPLCNIFVSAKEVIITADLPFAQPDTVKAEPINDDKLEITAEMRRKVKFEELGITHHKGEFSTFSCQVIIPVSIDTKHMIKTFKHGILEIRTQRKHRQNIAKK